MWRGLKTSLLIIFSAMTASLAMAQGGWSIVSKGKSPNTLTCSPAPCVLPNINVDKLQWGGSPAALVLNPSNVDEMILAVGDGNCGSSQGFFSTTDGGSTWSHSCIFSNNAVGGTIVGYDLNNRAFGGGIDDFTAILLRYSDNNGIQWSRSKVVDDSQGDGTVWSWMAVDTHPTSHFKNSLYVSSVDGGIYGFYTQVHVTHSADGGQHWQGADLDVRQLLGVYDLFPHSSVGDDGTVYVTWVRCKQGPPTNDCGETKAPVLISKSTDGGNTWTAPGVVAYVTLSPTDCGETVYGCLPNTVDGVTDTPINAVFGSGPTARVHVVFYDWSGTQMQVKVATSTDGGQTFASPVRVSNSDAGDQFLPWVSAAADGTIAVSWLDRRKDPANVKYQPFLATSVDGVHFGRSWQLASYPSDPYFFGLSILEPSPNLWMDTAVYSTWIDTRSGLARPVLGGVQF